MKAIHIIGHPGSGKTTLVMDIVRELPARGLSVGTIKHSSHSHELDKPGKDSHRHRTAGASPASMVTRDLVAVYMPRQESDDPAVMLEALYRHTDAVLIEGWISGPYDKIEVWREEIGRTPLFRRVDGIRAIVTDDDPEAGMPTLSRHDISGIADFIVERMLR